MPANAAKVKEAVEDLEKSLDFIENNFLKMTPYIAGEEISLADLVCIVEVMQPLAGGHDVKAGRPKLSAWIDRVKQNIGPLFDEAHKPIFQLTKK